MNSNLLFIYDGQCPFCNKFAELLELKSNLPNLQVKNARENPPEIPAGYDMDKNGAILFKGKEMLCGANAINYIWETIEKSKLNNIEHKSNLIGNISHSFKLADQNNYFYKEVCAS